MKDSTLHPLYPAALNDHAGMSLSKQRLRVWLRMLDRNRNFLNRLRASLRDDFETTLPRFDVMATLSWHEDGLRMSALSTHLKVSNGNVTGIVESLIREGLVLREVAPDDKRAATVRPDQPWPSALSADGGGARNMGQWHVCQSRQRTA
jgi:hypothetical protein